MRIVFPDLKNTVVFIQLSGLCKRAIVPVHNFILSMMCVKLYKKVNLGLVETFIYRISFKPPILSFQAYQSRFAKVMPACNNLQQIYTMICTAADR